MMVMDIYMCSVQRICKCVAPNHRREMHLILSHLPLQPTLVGWHSHVCKDCLHPLVWLIDWHRFSMSARIAQSNKIILMDCATTNTGTNQHSTKRTWTALEIFAIAIWANTTLTPILAPQVVLETDHCFTSIRICKCASITRDNLSASYFPLH
jgi:hypothetical protein